MAESSRWNANFLNILNRSLDPEIVTHHLSANVHSDERTCDHCTLRDSCWNEESNRMELPSGFRYRSGCTIRE